MGQNLFIIIRLVPEPLAANSATSGEVNTMTLEQIPWMSLLRLKGLSPELIEPELSFLVVAKYFSQNWMSQFSTDALHHLKFSSKDENSFLLMFYAANICYELYL